MATKIKRKIIFIFILCSALVCFALLNMGFINSDNAYAFEIDSAETFSQQRLNNSARSIEIFESIMPSIRTETIDSENKVHYVYDDSFAGVFIDENGILNIATVTNRFSTISLNTRQFNETVKHRHFAYSYNHLLLIKETIFPLMYTHEIFRISIDEMNNKVVVFLTNYNCKAYAINLLKYQGLYSETSINFIVDAYGGISLNSLHGGDYLYERLSENSFRHAGTIGAQAICTITGQIGVLTNEHVMSSIRRDVAYNSGFNVGIIERNRTRIGQVTRGEIGTNVDTSFIAFENQSAWQPSPYARRTILDPTTLRVIRQDYFRNIRLGNENQIVQGAAVKRIGYATGITFGQISSRNASTSNIFEGSRRTMRDSFTYTNYGMSGDSGGPVYIRGANNTLYLMGLHFATGNTGILWWEERVGFASRIHNIMSALNVRPITNDYAPTIIQPGTYELPISTNRIIHLHGNYNTVNIQLQFFNGQTRTLHIRGNSAYTTFGTHASEFQSFNRNIDARVIRIVFNTSSFRIQVSNRANVLVWDQTFRLGFPIPQFNTIGQIQLSATHSASSRNIIWGRISSFTPRFVSAPSSPMLNNSMYNINTIDSANTIPKWIKYNY
ncbi:MAG: S1 family peptidase [Firmicutes bacterium]|nr:S1 family peptidase [Bacillota bacterium]